MTKNSKPDENAEVIRRLDAIIRMFIELAKRLDDGFEDQDALRALYSAGLTPSEIARIAGLKSRTSVARQLYARKAEKRGTRKIDNK
jgi:hypothetical protein